jgi:hypothetical protein
MSTKTIAGLIVAMSANGVLTGCIFLPLVAHTPSISGRVVAPDGRCVPDVVVRRSRSWGLTPAIEADGYGYPAMRQVAVTDENGCFVFPGRWTPYIGGLGIAFIPIPVPAYWGLYGEWITMNAGPFLELDDAKTRADSERRLVYHLRPQYVPEWRVENGESQQEIEDRMALRHYRDQLKSHGYSGASWRQKEDRARLKRLRREAEQRVRELSK